MKSFVVCVLLIALVGAALCGRHRRQLPGIENGPPSALGDNPAAMVGAPKGVTETGSIDSANVKNTKGAKPLAMNDVNNQNEMGVPVPATQIGKGLDTMVPGMAAK